MASLTEVNEYTASITKVDINNDVPNNQLANRTLYLKTSLDNLQTQVTSLNTTVTTVNALQTKVNDLSATVNSLTSNPQTVTGLTSQINDINDELSTLATNLQTHKHNYAASSTAGGNANTVDITEDNINTLSLIGVNSAHPNSLRKNSSIYMEDNILHADTFEGDLDGIASSATKLYNSPSITLTGDVLSQAITFTGENNIEIETTLKEQGFDKGSYGLKNNATVGANSQFKVPYLTVSPTGVITSIVERTVTLSNNIGTNGVTSSQPTNKKIYLLGASSQSDSASIFTQDGVYVDKHILYSNDSEVVNLTDYQSIKNKVYNGYKLSDACEKGVDTTIGGTADDDDRLVTSNSLYRHTHKYAMSDTINGKAKYVDIATNNTDKFNLVGNINDDGSLVKNSRIYFQEDKIVAPVLKANEIMYIPGGRIWIDSVEVPVDEDAWSGSADIAEASNTYAPKYRNVALNSSLATVFEGKLLAYKKGGYVLADNSNSDTCNNVVLAFADSLGGTVNVINSGAYDLQTSTYDGQDCYVGTNGDIIYGTPSTTSSIYIKKIGYVEGSYLIFNPEQYTIYYK